MSVPCPPCPLPLSTAISVPCPPCCLQLVIVVSNVFWCKSVADCLSAAQPDASLTSLLGDLVGALKDLIGLVRGRLSSLLRKVRRHAVCVCASGSS